MIEKILIISFIVFAIHYTMQDGEIFGVLGNWFDRHLPEKLKPPVFDCPVCMGGIYGAAIYWIIWGNSIKEWIVVNIAVIGFNAILSKMFPPEDDNGDDDDFGKEILLPQDTEKSIGFEYSEQDMEAIREVENQMAKNAQEREDRTNKEILDQLEKLGDPKKTFKERLAEEKAKQKPVIWHQQTPEEKAWYNSLHKVVKINPSRHE